MKHFRNTVSAVEFSANSKSNLKRLAAIMLSTALLSACSTKISTDTSGASVANQTGSSNEYDYNTDYSDDGSSINTPQIDTNPTTPTIPVSGVSAPIRCYVYRPGGYFYVGQPVPWEFGTDTGEELEVVNITSNIPWTQPPTYPIASNFTITFHSPGVKRLSFTVRSKLDPSRVCNAGRPVNDQIVVNSSWY